MPISKALVGKVIIGIGAAYKNYRRSAKLRSIEFRLSKDEFHSIMQMNCTYCGSGPRKMYGYYHGTGIDRKNNSLGYVYDNCIPCCTVCNSLKSKMNGVEFVAHIQKINIFFKESAYEKLAYSDIYG